MEYKIAICDDSQADRDFISEIVRQWAAAASHIIHIDTFISAENFMFHYADVKDYDILLLDIEMGGMSGVAMAKELRRDNSTVQIVFITGYSDYISEGYDVDAVVTYEGK